MAEQYSKLWVHLVLLTKDLTPVLKDEIRTNLIKQLISVCSTKNYYIASLNGVEDHLHCLISYLPETSILSIINDLKDESIQWLNSLKNIEAKFAWQQDFAAFSVSQSKVREVKKFVAKQKEHHKDITFDVEWKTLLAKHKIQ